MTAAAARSGRFAGQVALVTGASSGIGAATAVALAAGGAAVAVNHCGQPEAATEVVARIRGTGARAYAVQADVSDGAQVATMVDDVAVHLGQIDILVNNAGVLSRSSCADLGEAEWDRVLGVNLKGTYLCCRQVIPQMTARGSGKIVNVASELGLTGEALLVAYCAAKGGVIAFTKALGRELIRQGVNVNAVAPGMTETPMLRANPITYNPDRERQIPAGRWAQPEEIAATICFLASSEANYYVGWVLSPNGGVVT